RLPESGLSPLSNPQNNPAAGPVANFIAARGERIYRWTLIACGVLSLLHMLALPLVMSWDGFLYVQLADILGHPEHAPEWDYLRTPLFPLLLKVCWKLIGRQALSLALLNTTFGFLGAWLVGATVKQLKSPILGACTLLFVSLYPVLVAYEHCMLTE